MLTFVMPWQLGPLNCASSGISLSGVTMKFWKTVAPTSGLAGTHATPRRDFHNRVSLAVPPTASRAVEGCLH